MNNDTNRPIETYTSEDALSAKQQGLLEQWVEQFLDKEGNHGLATALKNEQSIFIDLINFPLDHLNRIQGPEPEGHREELPVWKDRIENLQSKINDDHNFPPLIVTDYWNPFEIVDGNHRHEALVNKGVKKHWTIFILKHTESVKYLKQLLATYEN